MKKLIVTEQQLDRLVSFILEADLPARQSDITKYGAQSSNQAPDNGEFAPYEMYDEKTNDWSKVDPKSEVGAKKLEILKQTKETFISVLRTAKECDDITIWFGDVDKSNKWTAESIGILSLRVLSIGADGIRVKIVHVKDSEGKIDATKDKVYAFKFDDCFNITKEGGSIKLYILETAADKEGDKMNFGRNFVIDKFLSFEIISNNGNCKQGLPDYNDITEKMAKRWLAQVDKILKATEYTPGLFGMNNIFFFPKGFAAMDSILAKYGLKVDKKPTEDKVVFNVLDKSKKGGIEKNAYVQGIIDFENNIMVGDTLLEVPKGQEIVKGQKFEVSVFRKTSKSKLFLYKTRIEILEPDRKDGDINQNDTETDTETQTQVTDKNSANNQTQTK